MERMLNVNNTPGLIEELKRSHEESTDVVFWYDHGSEDGTVRGPFHRWFKVSGGEDYKDNVATIAADAAYCSNAMNYLPVLIEEYEKLKEKCDNLEAERILLGIAEQHEDVSAS